LPVPSSSSSAPDKEPAAQQLSALRDRIAARPNIAAYLASDRRIAFNEDGIFRHYRELDS